MSGGAGQTTGRFIKRLRLILSLLILLLFTLFFIFDALIPVAWGKLLTGLQFIPAFWKSLLAGTGTAVFGLIFITALTLLLGRLYCSSLCPLGTLQDIFIFLSAKVKLKQKFSFRLLPAWPRYLVLGIFLFTMLWGFSIFSTLLDPYSIFGRLALQFLKPALVFTQAQVAGLLRGLEIYAFSAESLPAFPWTMLVFTGSYLVLLAALAGLMGRTYCNTLCPVGTILGLLARLSLFRLEFIKDRCTKCGRCEQVCKSECISSKLLTIDRSRCISCFNCLQVCPVNGLAYGFKTVRLPPVQKKQTGIPRRLFLRSATALLVTGMGGLLRPSRLPADTFPHLPAAGPAVPVFPPGGEELARFTRLCTSCQLCVAKCPTRVLTADLATYGWQGVMQPYLNYDFSFCEYECHLCTQVCPSGALKSLTLKEKQNVQLGQVHFHAARCVVVTKGTACGACAEICPTHAVYMLPYLNDLMIPATDPASCVGCGGCQSVCPVRPEKAILVRGLARHGQAAAPVIRPTLSPALKKNPPSVTPEEFPF